MCFTERVRRAADPIWQAYFTHPFVTGIGDGSLSVEKFRFFLLQDYLYLYDYAKVFALGLLKSGIPEEMRFFSSNVDAVLNGEMNTHRAYMKRLGISDGEAESVRMSLANRAYTNYMLSVDIPEGCPRCSQPSSPAPGATRKSANGLPPRRAPPRIPSTGNGSQATPAGNTRRPTGR